MIAFWYSSLITLGLLIRRSQNTIEETVSFKRASVRGRDFHVFVDNNLKSGQYVIQHLEAITVKWLQRRNRRGNNVNKWLNFHLLSS